MKNLNKDYPLIMPRIVVAITIAGLFLIAYYLINLSTSELLILNDLQTISNSEMTMSQQIIKSVTTANLKGKAEGTPIETSLKNFTGMQQFFFNKSSTFNEYHKSKTIIVAFFHLKDSFDQLPTSVSNTLSTNFKTEFYRFT